MKKHYLSATIFVTALSGAAFDAHAGVGEFIDSWFTYRKDQKAAMSPATNNQDIPARTVVVPHYPEQAAKEWSDYYIRGDLVPYSDMDAATYVMRPNTLSARHNYKMPTTWPAPTAQHNGYAPGNGPQNPLIGQQGKNWRGYTNDIENRRSKEIYIGEPGDNTILSPLGTGQAVGRKTAIGEPIYSWREKAKASQAIARPGDFDYKGPRVLNDGGQEVTNSAAEVHTELLNEYTVESGDTLSQISEKERIYGDWKLWPLIYDANKAQVSDPDLIQPRQRLDVPRNYTYDQEVDARNRAVNKRPPHIYTDGK